jgi:hypothetical protein
MSRAMKRVRSSHAVRLAAPKEERIYTAPFLCWAEERKKTNGRVGLPDDHLCGIKNVNLLINSTSFSILPLKLWLVFFEIILTRMVENRNKMHAFDLPYLHCKPTPRSQCRSTVRSFLRPENMYLNWVACRYVLYLRAYAGVVAFDMFNVARAIQCWSSASKLLSTFLTV